MWWSWILTIVGLTGFVLAGRKIWWCWYINIACQALWFTYALVTHQYGFIVASIAYTVVFTKNAISWTKEHKYGPEIDHNEVAVSVKPIARYCGQEQPHNPHSFSDHGSTFLWVYECSGRA